LRLYAPEEAKAIIAHISAWQREYRDHQGLNLVYASDEWYLLAGLEVPPAEEYDGFPQLENGVGLTRVFLDEELPVVGCELSVGKVTLVCGTLIAALLEDMAAKLAERTGLAMEVVPVINDFFGPTVTVSGLLTGRDVIEALRGRVLSPQSLGPVLVALGPLALYSGRTGLSAQALGPVAQGHRGHRGQRVADKCLRTKGLSKGRDLGDLVFLPRAMFDASGKLTLDDMSPAAIGEGLGVRVEVAGTMGEVVASLSV